MPKLVKKHRPVRKKYDYDIALSFAGEDRKYVQEVADILVELSVKVFYDAYETAGLWGKDLYAHLDDVYQRKARYCLLFISKHYARKLWATHERKSATARAFKARREYILPARFDDTELPGLPPTVGYVDLRTTTPEALADLILQKISRKREINLMLAEFRRHLPGYEITVEGSSVGFVGEGIESWFPLRLMLEMYRADQFVRMFVMPAIVPN